MDDVEDRWGFSTDQTYGQSSDTGAYAISMEYLEYGIPSDDVQLVAYGCLLPVQRDALLNCNLSSSGVALRTLYYNLSHAIEHSNHKLAIDIVCELFATFWVLNRRGYRWLPVNSRETHIDIMPRIGPFENDRALAFHHQLFSELVHIFLNQIGMGTATGICEMIRIWNEYQEYLFCHPSSALARLVKIIQFLCMSKKDPTVGFLRVLFGRDAAMMSWRDMVTEDKGQLLQNVLSSEAFRKIYPILSSQRLYFNDRQRLQRYWELACLSPHPEVICQGGPMNLRFIATYVESLRSRTPNTVFPKILDVGSDLMQYLHCSVNFFGSMKLCNLIQLEVLLFLGVLSDILIAEDQTTSPILIVSENLISGLKYSHINQARLEAMYASKIGKPPILTYGVLSDQDSTTRQTKLYRQGVAKGGSSVLYGQCLYVPKAHENRHPCIIVGQSGMKEFLPSTIQQGNPNLQEYVEHFHRTMYCYLNFRELRRNMFSGKMTFQNTIIKDSDIFDFSAPCEILGETMIDGAVLIRGTGMRNIIKSLLENTQSSSDSGEVVWEENIKSPDTAEFTKDLLIAMSKNDVYFVGPIDKNTTEMNQLQMQMDMYQRVKERLAIAPLRAVMIRHVQLDSLFHHVTHPRFARFEVGKTYAWIVYIINQPSPSSVTVNLYDLRNRLINFRMGHLTKHFLKSEHLARVMLYYQRALAQESGISLSGILISFHVDYRAPDDVVVTKIRYITILDAFTAKSMYDPRDPFAGQTISEVMERWEVPQNLTEMYRNMIETTMLLK